MSLITAQLPFDFQVTGATQSNQYLMLKNSQQAYLLDASMTLTLISDADYPGWNVNAVTSITRSGTTATVTTSAATNIPNGSTVTMAGASQSDYNGDKVVTVTGPTTFTFTVANSPATPATGTITATGGITTVPGIVFLDGYFFVMDDNAKIYGCELNDPTDWNALNFISAIKEPGAGKAIAKSQNYVIAFKEWSTEFFFDAGNATGSPLSPVDNGFTLVGCAAGESVANVDGILFWVSQTRQKGRGVMMMQGLEQVQVSTPDIERILNADDLADIYAYGVKISGHTFYVLTLKTSDLTLVYDTVSKTWQEWSSLTINGSSVSVTSITRSDTTATVVCAAAHGLSDGDPVLIAGAVESAYNGIKQTRYISATSFSFDVSGSPATPATGTITSTGYTSSYFKYTKYVYANGKDLVLHETNGNLYEITESASLDDAAPIDLDIRTGKFDGDTTDRKTNGRLEVIGNKVSAKAMVRWTDDDYATYSAYRHVDLSAERAQINRLGSFRRRSYQFRYVGGVPVQVSALELDIGGG